LVWRSWKFDFKRRIQDMHDRLVTWAMVNHGLEHAINLCTSRYYDRAWGYIWLTKTKCEDWFEVGQHTYNIKKSTT
jgi:hypothetical protein